MSIPRPSLLSRIVRGVLLRLYRAQGWKPVGGPPDVRKAVLIGAPHTSSWDFLFFLGMTDQLGIKAHFMGKKSLFRWPLQRFMLDMGGVPVDRSASHNYVDSMIAEFAARDEFFLVIAPEGTRSGGGKWRSGFYHIALGAGVPIQCGWVDYENMRGGMGLKIEPSGDYPADMARIADFYRTHARPKHPEHAVTDLSAMLGQGGG